jgi:tetratricopeptide (TPR) repeat protein
VRLGSLPLSHRTESAGAVQSPAYASKGPAGLLPLERRRSRASPQLVLLCGVHFGASSAGEYERPSSAEAWKLIEAGQYQAALAKLDAAIELEPTVPGLFASRALAHLELGHADEAVEDCEASISLAPDDADAYLRLSSMCVTVGQRSRAIRVLQRGLQRLPGHEDIQRVLLELQNAEDVEVGTHELGAVAERAQEGADPISVAFTDLVARGRTLFRNLPQNEREDIFRALKASNTLVARMIRDACAVTVQCAIRTHQVPY